MQVQRPAPSQEVRHRAATQAAPGAQALHASPHAFPAHGSQHRPGAAVTQRPARSHAVAANVGHGRASPHGLQLSPHAFPAHGSTGVPQTGSAATQLPAASHRPATDGARHGGVADRQGGSMVQASPHALPSQGAGGGGGGGGAGQLKVPAVRHAPDGSQAFDAAVSLQPASPGAHAVQAAPHAFPSHGSYPCAPQPPRGEAATARRARRART